MTSLVTTLHDPNGIYRTFIPKTFPQLTALYASIHVVATPQTDANIIDQLRAHGAIVTLNGSSEIGTSRRQAIIEGMKSDAQYFHYCDIDRVMFWQITHPEELKDVVTNQIPNADYIILGRTEEAFNTHPPVQIAAETITNRAFGFIFDGSDSIDTTSGSNGFSRSVAEAILKHSVTKSNANDCEWPTIVDRLTPYAVSIIHTNGLAFETQTFHPDKDVFALSDTIQNWSARIQLAQESIDASVRVHKLSLK